ncbi:MAG: exodeoxyribonuclease VII small subunit [Bacteroidetes bacterium]|nr:MAG: exodeoxyribonuclease VII small subunit [Bacteroidota bacterium]
MKKQPKQEELTYETAMAELEEIVQKLDSDSVALDELAQLVKRANELAAFCKNKLREIESELEKLNPGKED